MRWYRQLFIVTLQDPSEYGEIRSWLQLQGMNNWDWSLAWSNYQDYLNKYEACVQFRNLHTATLFRLTFQQPMTSSKGLLV